MAIMRPYLVMLNRTVVNEIDYIISQWKYKSRSEFIRKAIQEYLEKHQ